MSERIGLILRALCLAGLASLLIGARLHSLPRAQNAAIKDGRQTTAPADTSASSRGVVAVVNDYIISDYDLNQRVGMFMATSGMRPNEEQMKRMREQVLRGLVDEMLQLQVAERNKITVLKADVDKALQSIAKQNNASVEQIEQTLKSVGVGMATLRAQLTAEIAWQKYLQGEPGGRVQISNQDVDEELRRIAEGAHKPQFLVSEIFIGVDTPKDDEKVRTGLTQIAQQLSAGGPFASAARQFSQSPSAAVGGDIGWVRQGQLAPELDKALFNMKAGDTAGPIAAVGGYYILHVRDRREPVGTAVPKGQTEQAGLPTHPVPLGRILLALPAKPSKALKDQAMEFGQELGKRIKNCTNLSSIAKQIQGASYMNLGSMKVSQMSPELKNALANTRPGDVASPFISSAGLEIIVRCDPKVEKVVAFQMPTRTEIENRLYQEHMSLISRRYLRDLRRDAVVEYR